MNPVQFEIEGRTWALLPLDEYQALCRQIEDAADAEAMRRPRPEMRNPSLRRSSNGCLSPARTLCASGASTAD